MALEGSIKEFGLAEIFQLISLQKKSGILAIHQSDTVATIHFYKGQIGHAVSSKKEESEKIGRRLITAGKLKESEINEALGIQANTGQRIGQILVSSGHLSREDLRDALQVQINDVIFQILRWNDGTYQFDLQDMEYDKENQVLVPTDFVLMEGVRMLDEWPYIESIIPSKNIIFSQSYKSEQTESLFSTLSREELEIFNLINGLRDITEIISLVQLSEFDVFKILATLHVSGLITQISSSDRSDELITTGGIETKRLWTVVQIAILLFAMSFILILMPIREMMGINEIFAVSELSRKTAVKKDLSHVHQALAYYFLINSSYPDSLEILEKEGYLKEGSLMDPWQNPFIYNKDPLNGDGYQLNSIGPDGKTGTSDDIY